MKRTAFGTMLNRFRFERRQAEDQLETSLWGQVPSSERSKYKVAIDEVSHHNGEVVIRGQLWKLVSEDSVRISTDIRTEAVDKDGKSQEDVIKDMFSE